MIEQLEKSFSKMGARVKVAEPSRWRPNLSFDIRKDKEGEFFLVNLPNEAQLTVLDVQPKDRHLLIMSKDEMGKHRFLMGHDERHWFVAAVPEVSPVSTVKDAKLALKPVEVREAERGMKTKLRDRRHNSSWIRQGEWFFVPLKNYLPDVKLVLKNEPLVRSRGGKPHVCSELLRVGGETVYVSRVGYVDGITEDQYRDLDDKVRKSRNWTIMKRNPTVYVRGTVRHSDHATIRLDGWHRVYGNTETLSFAMRNVTFLD